MAEGRQGRGEGRAVRAEEARLQAAAQEGQRPLGLPVAPQKALSLRLFMRDAPAVPDHALRRQWALVLACRGAALARVGRDAEAVGVVRRAVGIRAGLVSGDVPCRPPSLPLGSLGAFLPAVPWPLESGHLYDLACRLAPGSTLPGGDGSHGPADQAVSLLRCSVTSGFDNLQRLRTDPDLAPLRGRPDFQKLVHDLGARRPGRKGVAEVAEKGEF
jgi:hypothetical protein